MDGIYPALLQQGLEHILVIYKECLKTDKSPSRWLETKVSFIPKPGKQSFDEPGSIRPISLFSFLSKALECIIFWHLNKNCLRNKLSRNIFAYQEGISTEDALHNLTNKIEILSWSKDMLKSRIVVTFLNGNKVFKLVIRGTLSIPPWVSPL